MRLNGSEILALPAAAFAKLRGGEISMIFQEPMTALDPVYTIGGQIAETIVAARRRRTVAPRAAGAGAAGAGQIPSAARRLENYPHEMSGGMRQRAMIALALACSPAVLLADEPTTALDVTVQIQILLLLRQLQQELGMAIVFVTHDIGVAAEISDRIAVMYAGRFVETGTVRAVIRDPRHPYTAGLLSSTVHGGRRGGRLASIVGYPPDLSNMAPGCGFGPRCEFHQSDCDIAVPALNTIGPARMVRCPRPLTAIANASDMLIDARA